VVRRPVLAGLISSTLAGALCAAIHTPLPWMIGPLLAMAGARFAGFGLAAPRGGREVGQLVIGAALGLYFTPPVAREVIERGALVLVAAMFAALLAYAGAFFISWLSDTDRTTALFASVPGGAAEMTILGERFGGKSDRIAIAQSLRILMVVVVVPFAFSALGVHGADLYEQVKAPFALSGLGLLLACGAAVGAVFWKCRLPNAWFLGPLAVVIALTANGVQWSAMPTVITNIAQVLIGCALGSRFERAFLRSAPRFVTAVTMSILAAMLLSALFAALLSRLAGVPVPTMVLATAPGGIAEMCITAKVLQLGVPLVTAAHVARVILLVTTTAPLFRIARRVRAHLAGRGRRG
jgi:membrane AbrB-like protein